MKKHVGVLARAGLVATEKVGRVGHRSAAFDEKKGTRTRWKER